MSDLTNIMKKELREFLSISSIISVVMVVVIFAFMGTMMSDETDKIMNPSPLLIVNCDESGGSINGFGVDQIGLAYDQVYGPGTFGQYAVIVDGTAVGVNSAYVHDLLLESECSDAIVILDGFYDNIIGNALNGQSVKKGQVLMYFEYSYDGYGWTEFVYKDTDALYDFVTFGKWMRENDAYLTIVFPKDFDEQIKERQDGNIDIKPQLLTYFRTNSMEYSEMRNGFVEEYLEAYQKPYKI